jgi:hypothetical protein
MTARSKRRNRISEQFSARLIEMLESFAYRCLSQAAHRALSRVEIELAHHGGQDNGQLVVTFEDLVRYGVPRATVGPALSELDALGFIQFAQHGKPARAAEYRKPNVFLLTTRPELDGVGAERCRWRRFTTLEEAQAVADAARKQAVARRKSPDLKAAGSDSEPITVQIPNQCHALSGSDSEPLRTSESEPLSRVSGRVTNGQGTALAQNLSPAEAEIALSKPFQTPAAKISRPAASRRMPDSPSVKPDWSRPVVRELFGEEARERRSELGVGPGTVATRRLGDAA